MQRKLKEILNNNKGFTLIELLIVIAIIAILAAVLAPQYIQYIERSRQSNDVQVASAIVDAAVIAVADPANGEAEDVEIRWGTVGGLGGLIEVAPNSPGTFGATVQNDVIAVMGGNRIPPESKAAKTANSATDGVGNFVINISAEGAVTLNATQSAKWASELGMNLKTN